MLTRHRPEDRAGDAWPRERGDDDLRVIGKAGSEKGIAGTCLIEYGAVLARVGAAFVICLQIDAG